LHFCCTQTSAEKRQIEQVTKELEHMSLRAKGVGGGLEWEFHRIDGLSLEKFVKFAMKNEGERFARELFSYHYELMLHHYLELKNQEAGLRYAMLAADGATSESEREGVLSNIGYILTHHGVTERAVQLLQICVQKEPEHALAKYNLALAQLQDGKPQIALSYLEEVVRLEILNNSTGEISCLLVAQIEDGSLKLNEQWLGESADDSENANLTLLTAAETAISLIETLIPAKKTDAN